MFPLLQEYANIAYNNSRAEAPPHEPYRDDDPRRKVKDTKKSHKNQKKNEPLKPVVPVTSIDMPDWLAGSRAAADKRCVFTRKLKLSLM